MKINIQISCGELLDKVSILEIKLSKIKDKEKLKKIEHEFELLQVTCQLIKEKDEEKYLEFYTELLSVNKKLWEIEDLIRKKEKDSLFDSEFIKLARDVYFTNDERFSIKDEINKYFFSEIYEQKDYEEYK